MKMEKRKIVVVVEEVEAARTALQWALHNLLRSDDLLVLLHVFPSSSSSSSSSPPRNKNNKKNQQRMRIHRLKGFQLALSFKDLCGTIPDAKVEIVVREGDQDGTTIASIVREIEASDLVLGLHDHSFLHRIRMTMPGISIRDNLNCRILAIKQTMTTSDHSSSNLDFSLIDISTLSIPLESRQQKIPYQILPSPFGIIWRSRAAKGPHEDPERRQKR